MRNEQLYAYSLHQRSFQEKRAIYYLLTKENGIVHGVAKKGVPQFVPLTLFATGKKALKTFQQITIADNVPNLVGQQQYAALYVNEITMKLLPIEDSVPLVFESYADVITKLQSSLSRDGLKLALRIFEQALFAELGISVDFEQDCEQKTIEPNSCYRFITEKGWEKVVSEAEVSLVYAQPPSTSLHETILYGQQIISMQSGIDIATLDFWSSLYRQIVDYLFDYKPLQSRLLWQQYMRYQ